MDRMPAAKRKRPPSETDPDPGSATVSIPTNKKERWGAHKEDIIPVKIYCIGQAKRLPGIHDFDRVTFNAFDTGSKHTVTIKIFKYRYLNEVGFSKKLRSQTESKLIGLKKQIKPLEGLLSAKRYWNMDTSQANSEFPSFGLSRRLFRAFMFGMDDTNGKEGLRSLITEMLPLLDVPELDVIQTGSASHSSCFAAATILDYRVEESTSHHVTRNSSKISPTSSSSSEDCNPKIRLITSDILVFTQSLQMNKPIQTKLVISLKKGLDDGMLELIKELLARLPYQSGTICGMCINAIEAHLCALVLDLECDDPENRLKLYTFQNYNFITFDEHFDVNSFWNLIVDIGSIIKSK